MTYKKYGKGWFKESHRHKLARLGIKTGKKVRKRQDIITESFRKGEKVLKTDVNIGKKGEVEKIYGELLVPTGPLIGFSKKKIPKITQEDIKEFERKTGMGACVPISIVLRELGYGHIEVGQVGKKKSYLKSTPHFWIRTKDNKILDLCKPQEGEYWAINKIPDDVKNPEPYIYDETDINFWRKKLKKINYAIKVTNGPKLKGNITIDLNTIKRNHPTEFKIISNESYDKLRRTGVKLRPNEDVDGDGVTNIKDARPLNKKDFRDNSTLQKIADWVNNN